MGERDRREVERRALALGEQPLPAHGVRDRVMIGRRVEVVENDSGAQRLELVSEAGNDVEAIVVASSVAIAVDGEQDDRLDLREAVDDRAGAEVG